jgi:hypothetical protein
MLRLIIVIFSHPINHCHLQPPNNAQNGNIKIAFDILRTVHRDTLVLEIRCQTLKEDIQTVWGCCLYTVCSRSFYLMYIWLCSCLTNVFLLLCLIVRSIVYLCIYCMFIYLLYVYVSLRLP